MRLRVSTYQSPKIKLFETTNHSHHTTESNKSNRHQIYLDNEWKFQANHLESAVAVLFYFFSLIFGSFCLRNQTQTEENENAKEHVRKHVFV